MPSLKQLPAPVSHLKARLRSLKRPMVWGPALILGLIVLFTLGYWFRPGWFSAQRNAAEDESRFNPSLSPEDSAIGADIDSLPLLLKQFESAIELPDDVPQAGTPQAQKQPLGLLSQPPTTGETTLEGGVTAGNLADPTRQNRSGSLLANSSASTRANPLTQELTIPSFMGVQVPKAPSNVSPTVAGGAGSNFLPDSNFVGVGPSLTNAPLPANPLQSALEQTQVGISSPAIAPNSTSTATTPDSATGATLPGASAPTLPQTGSAFPQAGSTFPGTEGGGINYSTSPLPNTPPASNSFNYLTNPNTGTSSVDFSGAPTVPSLPTAPVAAPLPSNNGGSVFGQPGLSGNPSSTNLNNSGFSSTINSPATSTVPNNTRPFSAPRRVPGRYIGGGEINTFSNP